MKNKVYPFISTLFLSACLLLSGISAAQSDTEFEALTASLEMAVKQFELPGMAVGIVKDGELVFAEGFGVEDANTGKKVSPRSIFALASISKAFTAVAMATLVEEGKVDWEDKVITHFPSFQLYDPYATREMTIRDLFCHRSGLGTFDGDLLWYGTSYNRDEVVNRIRHLPPKYSFRSQYGYQNIMYITAAKVIENITGETWEDYIKKRILNPLGMERAHTSNASFVNEKDVALPHVKGASMPYQDFSNAVGAVGVNASIEDMAKWINFWLGNGTSNGTEIVSPESVAEILSSHTILGTNSRDIENGTHFRTYGMGWILNDYHGKKVVHHSGGLPGFILNLAIVQEENLGIIVLTNGETYLPFATTQKILDMYLHPGEGKDWIGAYYDYHVSKKERDAKKKKEREAAREKATKPSLDLKAYVGTYSDVMYGNASVQEKDGGLMLTLLPTQTLFSSPMKHWHHDTFQIKFKDQFLPEGYVTFQKDSNGNITDFTIDLPNPDFHFFNLKFVKQSSKE